MEKKLRHGKDCLSSSGLPRIRLWVLLCVAFCGISVIHAQKKGTAIIRTSVNSSITSNYQQVGNTLLYCYQSSNSIDFMGLFSGMYYGSTYGNNGYRVAMQVGDNSAQQMDCISTTTLNGVTFTATVEQQGELARVCYNVTNTNEKDTTVSLGIHADIMIGSNDAAPISKRIDTTGKTYGLTLKDGNGAQLCALFGSGLKGVTGADDYWFGQYSLNSSASAMVGNYSSGSNYMVENGSYDSGMGICWKNRTIPAGSTVTFSWLIGVGDVNLEPISSFEVTPEDPEGWNDLSHPHRLTLDGEYESPAGLDGMIEYAVENSEEWLALTDTLASGDTFTASLVANFDETLSTHTIHFRTVDNVGNATLLPSIVYEDVSFITLNGIEEKTYTGDSLYQTTLSCDLADTCYVAKDYQNNVNAGTASFSFEGVFPYTIGRKRYTFAIKPASLQGEITLSDSIHVYDGTEFLPEWAFTEGGYSTLVKDTDFVVKYENNVVPGTGRVLVNGIGNYCDSLVAEFFIDKAALSDSLYTIIMPDKDISYDGKSHEASVESTVGVGIATLTYSLHDNDGSLVAEPTEEGSYDVYLEIADGTLYYGMPKMLVGTFSIYDFDETEWTSLSTLYTELSTKFGWSPAWDFSQGSKAVSSFEGLKIEKGHVVGIDLSNKGLTGTFPSCLLLFPNISSIDLSSNNLSGDLATTMYAMVSQNPSVTANIASLDISGNNFSGNVGLLAQCFPSLTALDASNNAFEDVYPMISTQVTDLDLSHQNISRVINVNMSTITVDEMAKLMPTILLYDHGNQTYKTSINLLCTSSDFVNFDKETSEDWAMQLSVYNGQVSMPYVSAQNAYYGNSGDSLNVMVLNEDGSFEGSTFKIAMSFDRGDANFVKGVDATDLQATILYAFGAYLGKPFNFTAADTYEDATINVQDVVCTANILLAGTISTTSAATRLSSMPVEEINADAYIYVEKGDVVLCTAKPIAAISVKVLGSTEWILDNYGLTQASKNSNVVGYSLNGATLPVGRSVIGRCQSDTEILEVSIADAEANPITVSICKDMPTSIGSVYKYDGDDIQIYNMSGQKIDKLQNGVNIVKKDGRTVKVLKNNNK